MSVHHHNGDGDNSRQRGNHRDAGEENRHEDSEDTMEFTM
jgi:hypothetical protein